jgi:Protein of unknown function with HXXEE motif
VVGSAVTWGLLAAWAVHDLEEWATVPGWSRRTASRLSQRYPRVPERAWAAMRVPRLEATIAIGVVGVLVAAAALAGARSGGRSGFFQVVLLVFGLHAIVHVGQAVLARGYAPGLVTALVVVVPFSWWAWHQLDRAGLVSSASAGYWWLAVVAFPPVVIGARLAARGVARRVAPHGGSVDHV